MTIYVQQTDMRHRVGALQTVLDQSGFWNIQGMIGKDEPIVVKVNLASMSQTGYHYGTDPQLADVVVDL